MDVGPCSQGGRDRRHAQGAWLEHTIHTLYFCWALFFFVFLLIYFATGAGGPTLLAVQMVPVTIGVLVLNDLRRREFYPFLSRHAQVIVAAVYLFLAASAAVYLRIEFEAIRSVRLGAWNTGDYVAGSTVVVLVLEYTRRKYLPVFFVNLFLVLYCVYGYLVPGMFGHPGLSWRRTVSSLSIEMTTGVFERLPQLGLTLIGSFLLLLAALRAFGCIESILKGSSLVAARSPRLLPQAAVLGSFSVAAVSGSGAANAATTGSATIPMFIKAGFPRVYAAAVETASSLGGQLMPPLMGISAFLMAEMMGVTYFDVVARGFGPAIIYFLGVALAVHLVSLRFQKVNAKIKEPAVSVADLVNIGAYAAAVAALIWLMGYVRYPAMLAARHVFLGLLLFLSVVFVVSLIRSRVSSWREWLRPYMRLVDHFSVTASELTVLLATLGILTAAFTVTGVPDKVGVLLMQLAEFNRLVMVLTAFAFGYLIGMGLPVTPTYIVLAVVTTPFMVRAGFDPWVAHFFAFMVAVFGELSPPTSVTAAVTSRIAEASFTRTMWHALGMCLPLLAMMGAIFTRPELVVLPGPAQWAAFGLVLTGTLGLTAGLYGYFHQRRTVDRCIRAAIGLASLVVLFHPDRMVATWIAPPLLALVVYLLFLRRSKPRFTAAEA